MAKLSLCKVVCALSLVNSISLSNSIATSYGETNRTEIIDKLDAKVGVEKGVSYNSKSLEKKLKDCVEEFGEGIIAQLAFQGGYLLEFLKEKPSVPYLEIELVKGEKGTKYACGILDKKDVLVTKEIMEKELSKYLYAILVGSLDDLQKEESQNKKDIRVNTKINDNFVRFEVGYTVKSNNELTLYKSSFTKDVNIRLGIMHNWAKKLVTNELKDDEWIDITAMLDGINGVEGITTEIYPMKEGGKNWFGYFVKDEKSLMGKDPITFCFFAQQ